MPVVLAGGGQAAKILHTVNSRHNLAAEIICQIIFLILALLKCEMKNFVLLRALYQAESTNLRHARH